MIYNKCFRTFFLVGKMLNSVRLPPLRLQCADVDSIRLQWSMTPTVNVGSSQTKLCRVAVSVLLTLMLAFFVERHYSCHLPTTAVSAAAAAVVCRCTNVKTSRLNRTG